jgi:hypothetical protein
MTYLASWISLGKLRKASDFQVRVSLRASDDGHFDDFELGRRTMFLDRFAEALSTPVHFPHFDHFIPTNPQSFLQLRLLFRQYPDLWS